jgi:hypothetical protein
LLKKHQIVPQRLYNAIFESNRQLARVNTA